MSFPWPFWTAYLSVWAFCLWMDERARRRRKR